MAGRRRRWRPSATDARPLTARVRTRASRPRTAGPRPAGPPSLSLQPRSGAAFRVSRNDARHRRRPGGAHQLLRRAGQAPPPCAALGAALPRAGGRHRRGAQHHHRAAGAAAAGARPEAAGLDRPGAGGDAGGAARADAAGSAAASPPSRRGSTSSTHRARPGRCRPSRCSCTRRSWCCRGMLFAALVWVRLAGFHRRSAIAAAAADLAARPPRDADAEERQLGNILAELALAAGLPTPRLLLVDAAEPNAAAFGASHRDADVIATRGLLERLDRRETQGVVAHLVGSIGSGDLRLAAAVQAVFGTLGAMVLVFDLPFRRAAWTTLGDLIRAVLGRAAGGAGGAAERRPRRRHLARQHGPDAQGDEPRRALAAARRAAGGAAAALDAADPGAEAAGLALDAVRLRLAARPALAGAALSWPMPSRCSCCATRRRWPARCGGSMHGGLPPGGALQELGFFHAPQQDTAKGFRARASMVAALTPASARRLARLAALGRRAAPRSGFLAGLRGIAALPGWKRGARACPAGAAGAAVRRAGLHGAGCCWSAPRSSPSWAGPALASLVLRL